MLQRRAVDGRNRGLDVARRVIFLSSLPVIGAVIAAASPDRSGSINLAAI
jgi:hypothetical protein